MQPVIRIAEAVPLSGSLNRVDRRRRRRKCAFPHKQRYFAERDFRYQLKQFTESPLR